MEYLTIGAGARGIHFSFLLSLRFGEFLAMLLTLTAYGTRSLIILAQIQSR